MEISEGHDRIDAVQNNLTRCLDSFASAWKLMDVNKNLAFGDEKNELELLQTIKRAFILDSFKLSKYQKDYKDWESDAREEFINNDVVDYNSVVGKISKVNQKLESSSTLYEQLSSGIKIPEFVVSKKTLEKFGNQDLIEIANRHPENNFKLSQLFSLNPNQAGTLVPEFDIVHDLINLEFRLRIEKRIQLEILASMKNKLQSMNSTWVVRDDNLKDFLNHKVAKVVEQVTQVRAEIEKEKNDEVGEEEEEEEEEREAEVDIDDDDDDDDDDGSFVGDVGIHDEQEGESSSEELGNEVEESKADDIEVEAATVDDNEENQQEQRLGDVEGENENDSSALHTQAQKNDEPLENPDDDDDDDDDTMLIDG
ncbi:hypothetical protein LELG_03091 [Lodderomyces elongisporus NRRL YB-4239]|uniref:Uncharacterized protein n=1 Tax=Lodderomyces elongisporus (strain ATCC 11503 / CBS 2605 / JCM 1781 / NBRC 1676 / NRRL YB-4239) TaxID=379508 RepID=A5E0F4_LODEL|nr:hypothetical protein LELG_03091 [Lodderomyces elongisporus NRRL YB-4239]